MTKPLSSIKLDWTAQSPAIVETSVVAFQMLGAVQRLWSFLTEIGNLKLEKEFKAETAPSKAL